MKRTLSLCLLLFATALPSARAHGGRTNSEGCHNERATGGYHCHNAPASPARQPSPYQQSLTGKPSRMVGAAYYRNCAAARAAGAAPVRRGQPGYAAHLDRDNDGVGCE